MAITEFSAKRERKRIVYVGDPFSAEDERVFTDRGYEIRPYSEQNLTEPSELSATDSVIFSQNPEKPSRILDELTKYAQKLLDHDCRIYVRVANRVDLDDRARAMVVNAIDTLKLPPAGLSPKEIGGLGSWFAEREGNPLAPFIYLCDAAVSWTGIANWIAENPSGKRPNLNLKIDVVNSEGEVIGLPKEREILVQRAFWDCSVVHLRQMEDGISGAPVYRAYAEPAAGLHGPWPSLHFLKIGRRDKIAKEYERYQGDALLYVPFHLGPRLNLERCGLGAREGVLVGDFVEDAESLRNCACDGRAAPAIANLFNRTLRGWRIRSRREETSIPRELGQLFPSEIPEHRKLLIDSLGAKLSIPELRELFEQCDSMPVLVGAIHGDLHASNVLVRSGDAIVIDFEKVLVSKPLVFDAASLEAGLLVDGFSKDTRKVFDWISSIEPLYAKGAVLQLIEPCHPADPSAWFYDCVRQIRIHARELECHPGQYAAALALALGRKGCNPTKFSVKRETLRAAAYFLSEKILKAITGR